MLRANAKKKVSSPRRRVQRLPSSKNGKFVRVTLGLLIFVLFSLCLWGYFYREALALIWMRGVEKTTVFMGFTLQDVIVEGRRNTQKKEILSQLNLKRGTSLVKIDLVEAKKILEKLPWVKAASVQRQFPGTLLLRLAERDPVALWKRQGKLLLVDRDGSTVPLDSPYKYKHLLVITGDKAPDNIGAFMHLLEKHPRLRSHITGATHLRAKRWNIRLDNRIDVKLPEVNMEQAFTDLLKLEYHKLMTQEGLISIDMRLPGQLILRFTPEGAKRQKQAFGGHA